MIFLIKTTIIKSADESAIDGYNAGWATFGETIV